jgi:hypothetical protein
VHLGGHLALTRSVLVNQEYKEHKEYKRTVPVIFQECTRNIRGIYQEYQEYKRNMPGI